jgi:uncharacterized protein (DUF1800 family)
MVDRTSPCRPSRRALLGGALLAGAGGCDRVLSALAEVAEGGLPRRFAVPDGDAVDPDVHLLSRATFGPRPGDLDRIRELGRDRWLDEQLHPEHIDDTACELRTAVIDTVHLEPGLVFEFPPEQVETELARHTLLRAVYSKRQLEEVMTEVWADHFHVAIGKASCRHLRTPYDRDVLRRHALGRFRDLLEAATLSPAMLVYLDGRDNRRGPSPNENHARELLELHSLGAHGGYVQRDVMEAARALTGFVVTEDGKSPGSAVFVPERHDDGPKVVLGHAIAAGGGRADVDRLLDIVAGHPSTARRVAEKLSAAFVADDPPASVVAAAERAFTSSGGDLRAVVREILVSGGFFAAAGAKIKRPFRFVVSALRALTADTHAKGAVIDALGRMGQAPFSWPTPDGYPTRGEAWLGTLLERFRFAFDLASGRLEGARVPAGDLFRATDRRGLAAHLFGRAPTAAELGALDAAPQDVDALALALSSPAFQRY